MTSIRLMPALAIAAGVALTFKLSGLASAPWGAVFDAHAAGQAEAPVAAGADKPIDPASTAAASGEPANPAPEQKMAAASNATGEATTQGEASVLQSLAARREALNARERDLAMREQTLAVAERRVEERVVELKAIEARINAALGQRDAAQQEQITALIRMYESMKPGDAAKIFEKMDRGILVAVSSKMKPVKLGAVLALMDPGRAQDLTVLLANRLNPDQIMGPSANPPAAAPPGPAPAAAAPPAALQPDVLPQSNAAPPAPSAAPVSTLPADTLPAASAAPSAAAVPAVTPPTPPLPGKS